MQWLPSFVHWFSRTPLISSGTVSFNSVERCSPEPCSGRVHSSHSIEISTQLHQSTLPTLGREVSNRPPNILLWIVNLDQQVFESFSWIVLTNLSWAQPIFAISSPNNINQSIHHLKIAENYFVTNIWKLFLKKYFENYFVTNILKIISWLSGSTSQVWDDRGVDMGDSCLHFLPPSSVSSRLSTLSSLFS